MGLQNVWGPLIAWYLFLAGVGAGAYLVSASAQYMGERYRALVRPGVYLGAPLVAVGSLLLLADLGSPLNFWRGFVRPQSSMISVGMLIITVFIVLGLVHLAMLVLPGWRVTERSQRWIGTINGVFALGTAVYTGLLLGVVKAVPFWNTAVLPVLFLTSALSTGVGGVLLTVGLARWLNPGGAEKQEREVAASIHTLGGVDILLIAVEALVLAFFLGLAATSGTVAAESSRYLLRGGFALAFWMGVVVVGLVVPAALEVWSLSRGSRWGLARLSDIGLLAGVCLLIGGVVLRYAVLAAGMSLSATL